ncbi:BadF/BadG/BcrA/BcrD ATPase family protein [Clostridium sp.]|uniref:N-acetylglucosamine kinase n=1 Tax=Clostridium sp. TaxID=1506 RepID=UPI00262C6430|nr:BadF/BadG/BcrA/BcrD ATPase family protein [Clostridium sp.]
MYYLGVDGGGTKTKYLLIDKDLNRVSEVEGRTIHIHQIGVEGIKEELTNNLKKLCIEGNIKEKDIEYSFLGVPGYGESNEDMNEIDEVVKEVFKKNYLVGNDAVNGWAAGTSCKPGINMVAGTGSIAYGRNKEGKIARSGGFGPGIGDDGSAYWIGLKAINEYTKQKDGRRKKTVLLNLIEEEYNISYTYEIVDIVFNRLKFNRTEIAKFSRIAALAAERGCEASIEIFKEAAKNIFEHIEVLAKELDFNEEFILSYTGGVFKSGDLILNPLKDLINKSGLKCKLQEPKLDPWYGSALLAYNLAGNIVPDNIDEIFK